MKTSIILSAALALSSTGCALTPHVQRSDTRAGYRLFDGRTGEHLTRATAEARLLGARVVYVGEHHGERASHATQLEVLRTLESQGRPLVIGVEWLPPSASPALDSWLAGDEAVADLAERIDWRHRWGHDFSAYAPIFQWARRRRVPIVPLNAERKIARAVAKHGLAELPAEIRAQLPPLDTGNEAHRAFFDAAMAEVAEAHAIDAEAMERYYLAQLVWDETMSRAVAAQLAEDPEVVLVVFAGVGHIDHGLGVPLRALALSDAPFRIVRPARPGEVAELGPYPGPDAEWPEALADLIWVAARPR